MNYFVSIAARAPPQPMMRKQRPTLASMVNVIIIYLFYFVLFFHRDFYEALFFLSRSLSRDFNCFVAEGHI